MFFYKENYQYYKQIIAITIIFKRQPVKKINILESV